MPDAKLVEDRELLDCRKRHFFTNSRIFPLSYKVELG